MTDCAIEGGLDDTATKKVVGDLVDLVGIAKQDPNNLLLAIRKKKFPTAIQLLDAGYSVDASASIGEQPYLPLMQSIAVGSFGMTKELIKRGASVSRQIFVPLDKRHHTELGLQKVTLWEYY